MITLIIGSYYDTYYLFIDLSQNVLLCDDPYVIRINDAWNFFLLRPPGRHPEQKREPYPRIGQIRTLHQTCCFHPATTTFTPSTRLLSLELRAVCVVSTNRPYY